jgi:hypothetical protein
VEPAAFLNRLWIAAIAKQNINLLNDVPTSAVVLLKPVSLQHAKSTIAFFSGMPIYNSIL